MAEPTTMMLGAPQVVALTGASAQSAAIGTANASQPLGYTTCRVAVTADTWLAIGANPTAAIATAGSFFAPFGSVEYLDIPLGSKIAGIVSAAGTLSITPAAKA